MTYMLFKHPDERQYRFRGFEPRPYWCRLGEPWVFINSGYKIDVSVSWCHLDLSLGVRMRVAKGLRFGERSIIAFTQF